MSTSTTDKLTHLHETHAENMEEEELMDYLLSCQTFLMENDLDGWIKNFAPETLTQEPPKKRRRGSPNDVKWKPLAACKSCKSNETVEDVKEGTVVCTACGIIQDTNIIGNTVAFMSIDGMRTGNRDVVHRYSRLVYFRSILNGLQGLTSPEISEANLTAIKASLGGAECSVGAVKVALKKLGLLKKYRRHIESITHKMTGGRHMSTRIEGPVFFEILRLFRRVEYFWDRGCSKNMPGRRVFMSYPYVFYQLCFHMGLPHSGLHHLLKSKHLQGLLHKSYGRLAKRAGLRCDISVFR